MALHTGNVRAYIRTYVLYVLRIVHLLSCVFVCIKKMMCNHSVYTYIVSFFLSFRVALHTGNVRTHVLYVLRIVHLLSCVFVYIDV